MSNLGEVRTLFPTCHGCRAADCLTSILVPEECSRSHGAQSCPIVQGSSQSELKISATRHSTYSPRWTLFIIGRSYRRTRFATTRCCSWLVIARPPSWKHGLPGAPHPWVEAGEATATRPGQTSFSRLPDCGSAIHLSSVARPRSPGGIDSQQPIAWRALPGRPAMALLPGTRLLHECRDSCGGS